MTARLGLVVAIALTSPACFFASVYGSAWPTPVESFRVRTSDGWTLDLKHVPPQGMPHRARPVVVMHGLVANGRNMDLDPTHSIARDLARRGFDVWIPSLRNVGASEKRSLLFLKPEESDFDAYVKRDLPAILAEVRARTGSRDVDYVGHSMGGMILYAYLSGGGGGIARAVTLGSPVRLRWTGRFEELFRATQGFVASASPWFPLRELAASTLPIQGDTGLFHERIIMSPENTSPATWRELLALSVDNVPAALMRQFGGWVVRNRFDSEDHSVDYLGGLGNVHVPILIMAGKVDGIAPPWMVRPAFDTLGSTEKEWLVLGEANGQRADYNHMDMVIGDRAPREVFERVAAFLSR